MLRASNSPILITGHTGFKGAWLVILLKTLGIPAVGYSLEPAENSLYNLANLTGVIPECFADIRDRETFSAFLDLHKPQTILHMAAQPLVLKSYEEPFETFSTNVLGTAAILEASFKKDFVKRIGVVTTDKVYENKNTGQRFLENDPLRGKDPYSASKVGTEAVVAAWQQISKVKGGPRVISFRAGNVIGGGDLADDRIIPDLVRAYESGTIAAIRNPESTRPWQHALDPLLGYLTALDQLEILDKEINSLNFGPVDKSLTVQDLLTLIKDEWLEDLKFETSVNDSNQNMEAIELGLDSTLAETILGWRPTFTQPQAISETARWWKNFIKDQRTARELCDTDIKLALRQY